MSPTLTQARVVCFRHNAISNHANPDCSPADLQTSSARRAARRKVRLEPAPVEPRLAIDVSMVAEHWQKRLGPGMPGMLDFAGIRGSSEELDHAACAQGLLQQRTEPHLCRQVSDFPASAAVTGALAHLEPGWTPGLISTVASLC